MVPRANILMIGWEYPPHNSGGLGVACEGMTKALSGQNAHIYFTLPYGMQAPVPHMQVLDCSDPRWRQSRAGAPPFQAYATAVVQRPSSQKLDARQLTALPQGEMEMKVDQYAEQVAKHAAALTPELAGVHAHDWMSFPAAKKMKEDAGVPVIAHIHSTEFDRIPGGTGSQFIMQTEYEGMQIADQVIAVSYYTKQLLIDKYGVDPAKIHVVHNGIDPLAHPPDTGTHHFASKRPVIVFMGRLTAQKGTEYFLELARQVLQKMPDALFVVAGSGDMYHELLFRTAHNKLTASVLFSGFVRDVQREKLLDRADIFVMPSVSEPFGLVALEAAQRHTPVIMSKSVGVSEVMPSSITLDFWDTERMAQVIVELLQNREQHQQTVSGQLKDLEQITWENAATKIMGIYRDTFVGSRT